MKVATVRSSSTLVAAALAGGIGIGVGQGFITGHGMAPVQAQASLSRSDDERVVIDVVRRARPAVVRVKRGEATGSGVVIRKDGVILTNAHVVDDAKTVEIRLANGKTLTGQVLGVDAAVDIAVVKVSATDMPEAPMADSDRLDVGQRAIAIGNPMGLEGTVTTGVVSATNRNRSLDDFVGFIQTDAAINPGNSGGPLLDSEGRVMGINTWILGRSSGLGFAVPINVARDVAQQVLETGKVRRAVLGVMPGSVTPEIAQKLKLAVTQGAAVVEVSPGTPAEAAGLKAEDVITQIDGQSVANAGDLRRILRGKKPGDSVSLTVRRGAQTLNPKVQLSDGS